MHNKYKKEYKIISKDFNQFTIEQLYEVLQLRNEVFIVEQNCPYQDIDGKDIKAHHLMLYDESQLIAYARIFNKGIFYEEASIGRIITSKKVRSLGVGKTLMEKSIELLYKLYGKQSIRIGAQCYAIPFYEKFEFKSVGKSYIEDGIEHIHMIKKG